MDIKKELQDLCDRYKAEAEKILEKAKAEKKVWKPVQGENYWFVGGNGDPCLSSWNDHAISPEYRYSVGNCFKTEEEVKFAVEKLKVVAELKRFAEEHNEKIDWMDDRTKKFCISYDNKNKKFDFDWNYLIHKAVTYFSSEEIAKAAIEAIGEERLKKYYFEVEG